MKLSQAPKFFAFLVSTLLATGSPLLGVEGETSVSSESSKNPITGTTTETKKFKKRVKHRDGKTGSVEVQEKTKTKTDGTVEQKVDEKSSTPPPAP
jgi:hypothetical protein